MKNDFIKRQDVARFMFENRYSTSINNAYDQLKNIPVSYDLDGAIKELEEKVELAYNSYMDCAYHNAASERYRTQYQERKMCLEIIKNSANVHWKNGG